MELIISTALGILSGLGVGGGSLMLLWLTAGAGADPDTARCINLLYYIPVALISTHLRGKNQLAPRAILWAAALSGIAGTFLGSFLRNQIVGEALLRKAMGFLFVVTAVRELLYRDRELR